MWCHDLEKLIEIEMKHLIYLTGISLLIAGCGEVQVPVVGVVGNERAQGQATARMDGEGTFFIATPRGLECKGTYDALDMNPTIKTPVSCNDGRTGTCIITRNLARSTGSAICSDTRGVLGRFVFGDVSFNEALGDGGATTR